MEDTFLRYLENMRFFTPSEPLTLRFYEAIEETRRQRFRLLETDECEVESSALMPFEASYANQSQSQEQAVSSLSAARESLQVAQGDSLMLRARMGGRLAVKEREVLNPLTQLDKAQTLQRLVREELYYHLAFLARGEQAKEGQTFNVRKVITARMSLALGVPKEHQVMADLAQEFAAWLNERGEILTGWGKILLASGSCMSLHETHTQPDSPIPSTKRVLRNPLSSRKRPAKKYEAAH